MFEEGAGGGEDEAVGGEADAVADQDDIGEVLLLEELQPRLGEGRRQRRGSGQRGAGRAEGLLEWSDISFSEALGTLER